MLARGNTLAATRERKTAKKSRRGSKVKPGRVFMKRGNNHTVPMAPRPCGPKAPFRRTAAPNGTQQSPAGARTEDTRRYGSAHRRPSDEFRNISLSVVRLLKTHIHCIVI